MLQKYLKRTSVVVVILLFLIIPTFIRMLRPGIYSIQDPHVFRMYEYDLCIQDGQFPCRWSPDGAYRYGEPVFNYYGQLPFLIGELFVMMSLSIISSVKAVFIFSFIGSAVAMF